MKTNICCGLVAGFAMLSIMGCNREAAPVAAPEAPVVEAAPAVPKVDTATCKFCAEPATVRVCDVHTGIRTRLHWHLADTGVPLVNMFVVDENGVEKAFAQHGPEGSMQTGPWLRPGLVFRLRDDRDASQIGEVIIEGVPCTP